MADDDDLVSAAGDRRSEAVGGRAGCEAVVGLMQETDDVLKETKAGPVRDAALVACARALEGYEVARYGAIAEWLGQKGHTALAAIAEQSLAQARQADAKLGQLARQEINATAAQS